MLMPEECTELPGFYSTGCCSWKNDFPPFQELRFKELGGQTLLQLPAWPSALSSFLTTKKAQVCNWQDFYTSPHKPHRELLKLKNKWVWLPAGEMAWSKCGFRGFTSSQSFLRSPTVLGMRRADGPSYAFAKAIMSSEFILLFCCGWKETTSYDLQSGYFSSLSLIAPWTGCGWDPRTHTLL